MKRAALFAVATALAAGLVATHSPSRAETLKIIVHSGMPPVTTQVRTMESFFFPEIDKRLKASGKDFKVQWTKAWAQSLAKMEESFEATEEGIGHIGLIPWVVEPAKLPLEVVAFYLPFTSLDAALTGRAIAHLHKVVPEMDQQFTKHNQVHLVTLPSENYHLATKFKVTKLEDLKGKKIGTTGVLANLLKGSGATVVFSNMTQAYTSLRNGVYDGYPISYNLSFPYKVYEAAPYFTIVDYAAPAGSGLSMNKTIWDKMPPHAQKIFKDVAEETAMVYLKAGQAATTRFEGIMRKKGLKVHVLPPEERKRWAAAMPNVGKEWAESMEKRGLPGKKVVREFMKYIRENGGEKDILRHWDKEL
ncbi:MAG: TRAP transporter substrate-binding protein DctP [Beijerinckiaceae bacterium]